MAAHEPAKKPKLASPKMPDDPWKGAHEKQLSCGATLQLVGLSSPTHTLFGRIVLLSSETIKEGEDRLSYSVRQVVLWMLDELQKQRQMEKAVQLSTREVLQLGAVWKLTSNTSSTGTMKRTRQFLDNANDPLRPTVESLRVHFRPSRFPAANLVDWSLSSDVSTPSVPSKHKAILHYDADLGFAIIHKPSGLPSHATVDNGVENVLYQLELQQRRGGCCAKPSLPQRLDIETEGLLLVATKPEFSAYMGRILQQKSLSATASSDKSRPTALHKQYRCLVRLTSQQQRQDLLRQTREPRQGLVEHYMDPSSLVPKTFQLEPREGWLKCLLRIIQVGPAVKYNETEETSYGDGDGKADNLVMQVQVELLTGRTHQIRGQFAAMNLPLVGDPLYGQPDESIAWDARRNRGIARPNDSRTERLGLQCCALSFPKPIWHINEKKKRPFLMKDEIEEFFFRLDNAWWSAHFRVASIDENQSDLAI